MPAERLIMSNSIDGTNRAHFRAQNSFSSRTRLSAGSAGPEPGYQTRPLRGRQNVIPPESRFGSRKPLKPPYLRVRANNLQMQNTKLVRYQ